MDNNFIEFLTMIRAMTNKQYKNFLKGLIDLIKEGEKENDD